MTTAYDVQDDDQELGLTSGLAGRPLVTWALLAVNGAVWLGATAAGGSGDRQVLIDFGAMFGPLIVDGEYWRLFTAIFLHVGIAHLAFNAFGLFIFGSLVESVYGHARFALIYAVSGLTGGVASFLVHSVVVGAGASGAIFGVLGALAAYFVAQRRILGGAAWRSMIGVLILAALNLAYGFMTPGIDNIAHLGGLAAGAFMGLVLAPSYTVVASAFGANVVRRDTSRLVRRLWVVPVAAVLLAAGTWLATTRVPDNAFAHYYTAVDHLEARDYDLALEEAEMATTFDPLMIEAYYVKAEARLSLGDKRGARVELSRLFAAAEVIGTQDSGRRKTVNDAVDLLRCL